MAKYAQGIYELLNPKKYAGNKRPYYRSSWENAFMRFCDNHPGIINWASEAVQIPYRNPLTGKQTIHVPDFFITYQDKKGRKRAELIEVKPNSQTRLTERTSKRDKLAIAINHAKWEAAAKWCKLKGVTFRVVTENDMFHKGKRR